MLLLACAAWGWWTPRPQSVSVNFISYPFQATIELDGVVLADPSGRPYETPCTIDHLPAREHRVLFHPPDQVTDYPLSDLDVGQIDFARQRQVVGRWSERGH